MTLISTISIIGWILQLFLPQTIGFIPLAFGKSAIFFNEINFHPLRNSGCFGEPGLYACYLLFVIVLFSNEIPFLINQNRYKTLILFIALLTTQSTTGYITFIIFIFAYLIVKIKSHWKYVFIVLLTFSCTFLYSKTDFLGKKINAQMESTHASQGDFNSTRMGSFIFDLHYIKKHPIVGNGLHERTRYADHPYLISMWKEGVAMSGNGFSGRLSEMGLLFYFFYIFFFFKTNKNVKLKDLWLSLTVVLLILQGEQLFNYPLLSVLPFISLSHNSKTKKQISNTYLKTSFNK